MSNLWKNLLRTLVPVIIGTLAAYWAKVSASLSTGQFAALVPAASTVYYAVIRWAEERYHSLSWLLGAPPVVAAPKPVNVLPSSEPVGPTSVAAATSPAATGNVTGESSIAAATSPASPGANPTA